MAISPFLGSFKPYVIAESSSPYDTSVTLIMRSRADGTGMERYMNGSNLTDLLLHVGQTNVDRY